jgi:hypothetical protein
MTHAGASAVFVIHSRCRCVMQAATHSMRDVGSSELKNRAEGLPGVIRLDHSF